ncbi:MAG: biopolymer transporter ExbD [Chlamydiae bacterium]|nr:biopolymer transporter ExbD [Chlamydiota bacterium]
MRNRIIFTQNNNEEAGPNLTPLIDVVFVVLIMFIIIAPMLQTDKIKLADAPKRDDKSTIAVQDVSPITIQVRQDNSIWLNSIRISQDELLPLLKRAKSQYPNKTPQLLQDKKAAFGTYQIIKNAVESSGFQELDVILQPG